MENSKMETITLKLIQSQFFANPLRIIKSLLGQDVEIDSYHVQPLIIQNGYSIVVVKYKTFVPSDFKIYWIKKSDVKLLSELTNLYAVKLNGYNVMIYNFKYSSQYNNYIPLKINFNYDVTNTEFKFKGSVQKNILNSLITTLHLPTKNTYSFDLELPDKLYDTKDEIIEELDRKALISKYKMLIRLHKEITIKDIIIIEEFTDSIDEEINMGYLIDWRKFVKGIRSFPIFGVIFIHSERNPFDIVFISTNIFRINKDEIESIDKLLKYDYINYLNQLHEMNF
jgi:hypothetical protein